MKNKLILSHLCFVIISGAFLYFKITHTYLIWNMFLALAALDFSFCLHYFKNAFLTFLSALLWFLFYPNTFYMLTDIVHMNFLASVLNDRSSLILYFVFLASVLFGLLCGVESVQQVFKRFVIKDYYFRFFLIILLSCISSLAIHIGRYARLNSWDIFTKPMAVISEIMKVLTPSAFPFILGFTFIQIMVLLFLEGKSD
ncbi:DUF1361 domain-containing protein [Streptococcus macacae]|uniref:Membrane protein n=1 Tax=Streptococcus macacae NCTC 11558 TaxID=764298 RepID=G5JXX9_9STRE|nr:DUF1361 domain-containing protein [Streptococcus macacae]EHJ53125.1 putative membrane protein [Streptococcus macacae NCTC 11558]SUN77898.1 membrane protein [Streptococcus macacae NCTC 11558]